MIWPVLNAEETSRSAVADPRAASLAGICGVSVPGVEAGGLGMFTDEDPQRLTVTRTGLNEGYDFYLEQFGIGQKVCGCPRYRDSSIGVVFLSPVVFSTFLR